MAAKTLPPIPDLVAQPGIAQMFGVKLETVHQWRTKRRDILPEPDAVVSGIPVWHRAKIVAWGEETGRALVATA